MLTLQSPMHLWCSRRLIKWLCHQIMLLRQQDIWSPRLKSLNILHSTFIGLARARKDMGSRSLAIGLATNQVTGPWEWTEDNSPQKINHYCIYQSVVVVVVDNKDSICARIYFYDNRSSVIYTKFKKHTKRPACDHLHPVRTVSPPFE